MRQPGCVGQRQWFESETDPGHGDRGVFRWTAGASLRPSDSHLLKFEDKISALWLTAAFKATAEALNVGHITPLLRRPADLLSCCCGWCINMVLSGSRVRFPAELLRLKPGKTSVFFSALSHLLKPGFRIFSCYFCFCFWVCIVTVLCQEQFTWIWI